MSGTRSHMNLGGAGQTQNQGNVLGDRPCVRQSQTNRAHMGGNAMKQMLGQDNLCWNTQQQEGAYAGKGVWSQDANGAPRNQQQQQPPQQQQFAQPQQQQQQPMAPQPVNAQPGWAQQGNPQQQQQQQQQQQASGTRSHMNLGGAGQTQNQGNILGDRPCVRQSQTNRAHMGGNAMKSMLGQDNLCWNTQQQEGAYAGKGVWSQEGNARNQQQQPPQQQQQQPPQQQQQRQQPQAQQPGQTPTRGQSNRQTFNVLTGQ